MSGSGSGFLRLVALVAQRDYLRTVRRRGFVFGTLLLPLSIGLFFVLSAVLSSSGFSTDRDPTTVVLLVVDESTVALPTDGGPAIELVDRATAEKRLADGLAAEYYLVPSTWPDSPLVTRVTAPSAGMSLDASQRRAIQGQMLETVLRVALLADAGLPQGIEERILVPAQLGSVTSEGQAVSELSEVASYLVPFAIALLFVMSIFITSGYLLQSVTEEKENRVVEIVLSSVPSLPLMAGKILGLGAAGLTQVVVWLLTALLALPLLADQLGGSLDLEFVPAVLALALVYFVLGYLAYGGIFAAIGALAPGNREAQQYSGFFGFFAVIPMVLSGLLLSDPESPIVWLLAIIPLTAPATMLQVIGLVDPIPWPMVAASLLSLVIFVGVATIASSRIFRATLLLYGVRPGLRELTAAVLDRR